MRERIGGVGGIGGIKVYKVEDLSYERIHFVCNSCFSFFSRV